MFATLKRVLSRTQNTVTEPAATLSTLVTPEPPPAPVTSAAEESGPPMDFTLRDAYLSGWFHKETGELFTGFKVDATNHVLDVGCGDGNFIHFCATQGAEVTFVDVDAAKIEEAVARLQGTAARGIHPVVSDASPLPMPANHFDKVVAMEVMEHVDHPADFLAELVRVGKPGALYLLSVPDITSETVQRTVAPAMYFEKPNHINIFSGEEFAQLVRDSGLIIEKQTSYGFFWSVFWAFFWTCDQELTDPWHPLLAQWGKTWETLLTMRDGPRIKQALDKALPKSQAIIARKPE